MLVGPGPKSLRSLPSSTFPLLAAINFWEETHQIRFRLYQPRKTLDLVSLKEFVGNKRLPRTEWYGQKMKTSTDFV